MSSTCPFPDRLEDGMVNGMENRFADHMTVIERPSTYLRVQFRYQFACGQIPTFFDPLSDLAKKCLHILLRGGNEEFGAFSSAIFAYRLPKEVEPLLDMRHDGLLH